MQREFPSDPRRARAAWWTVLLVVWLGAVGSTFAGLTASAARPAAAVAGPERWPDAAGLSLDAKRLTLVMWVHPRCPCTRASARELAELMVHAESRVHAIVLVATPAGAPEGWDRTGLVGELAAIPGVEIVADDGAAQTRFGATTSGEVRLYAPSGERLFVGGITSARGHEGDNEGRAEIEAFARGLAASMALTPADGCPLSDA